MTAVMRYNIISKIPFTICRKVINMDKRTLRRLALDVDDVISMYQSGSSVKNIADKHNCSCSAITNCLKRNGVYAGRDWKSYLIRNTGITPKELLTMYESGMWKNEIAEEIGLSEGAVGKYLAKLGISIAENRSKAMKNRLERMTQEERDALSEAAHDAVRGSKRSWKDLTKRAKGLERVGKTRGKAESDLFEIFKSRGIKAIPQKAVGKYNIDFVIGNIAVEVTGRNRKLGRHAVYKERIKYILDSGFSLVYVWANSAFPIQEGAADYIISLNKRVGRNPSLIGKYWVIRCDGKLLATGCSDDNDFAGILTSVSGTYAKI